MTSNPYQSSTSTSAPRAVNAAFWLYLVTALTHVIALIIGATQLPAARQAAQDQLDKSGTSTGGVDVNAVVNASFTVSIVIGVLFIIAFVVFDLLMRRGANWARIVLLVLTILGITGIASGFGIGAIGVIASIVAAVLTFLPASSAWFRSVKDRKRGALGR